MDIKLSPFTKEELDTVLRKIKNRKAAWLDEISPEIWKTRQFDDTATQSIIKIRWTDGEGVHPSLP